MTTKRFDLKVPREYEKNGEKKTYWNTVGTYMETTKDDGTVSRRVEIPAISLSALVFEQKPREEAPQQPPRPSYYPEEDINPDDIPF